MNLIQKLKLMGIAILTIILIFVVYQYKIKLGLDLQGGSRLILECVDTPERKVDDAAVLGVIEVIRNRIDSLGVTEPVIQPKGQRQIVIELPGIEDPDRAVSMIGETALLEFIRAEDLLADRETLMQDNRLQELYGPEARIASYDIFRNGAVVGSDTIVLKETVLTGADLQFVGITYDNYNLPLISIKFKDQATKIFSDITRADVGKRLAIVLDGKIISAPQINVHIANGDAVIEGNFSEREAMDLVIKLKAGSFPVPVEIVSNQMIGPSLGRDSIDKSKVAGILGFLLIILFMILYYRLPGFLASLSLSIYVLLVSAIFILGKFTLTLPGIAAFIITIGMAVDANILIFERLKEELRSGKILRNAITASFSRAFITILDANLTTLIAILPLLWLGTGSIKGFAVVMIIGTICSMFSAIVITRVFLDSLSETNILQNKWFILK